MSGKSYKAMLAAAMAVMFLGASVSEWALTREREALGLNRYAELKGAPPVLMLTTVALGGFRGLISNALWMRASELQEQDKYFEMVQLADWITKLEPHYPQVWLMQSWNMAFNISVKFNDPADRWRWLERGIELLRDQGLVYNPYDHLLYRELAWFFQFKLGGSMDDAQMYYKAQWAQEMYKVFEADRPNWDALIHPRTPDEQQRAALLRDKYKLDPVLMKKIDEQYGPLEWRLPEAHAIYWAERGLEVIKQKEGSIDPDESVKLYRVVFQSMHLAVQRGRLITVKSGQGERIVDLGPNLAIIDKANAAYEEARREEKPQYRDTIDTAHRNLVLDIVFLLYTYNRRADAQRWYQYLIEKFPDKPLLLGRPDTLPKNMSLDDFALTRIADDIKDLNQRNTKAILEGLERQSLTSLADGDDDRAEGMHLMARRIWTMYQDKMEHIEKGTTRLYIAPLEEIRGDALQQLLNGELSPEETAVLKTATGQPNVPPPAAKPESGQTNLPPAAIKQ
jgi:hypothetical protein